MHAAVAHKARNADIRDGTEHPGGADFAYAAGPSYIASSCG